MWPVSWTGFIIGRVLRPRSRSGFAAVGCGTIEGVPASCPETGAMLELRDSALKIAATLQAVKEPDPLRLELRNHSPATAA
ncbi:hypothetical protein SAE02_77320 [Skermanella aerolata]|uniref:Uncharacterized protein n=1 Tax=Skermanella aerolata TaxID=393310 RepID=A0A512E4B0_9PROT|nr:hypothetical protein SAE02_77320 [Skermanella aerolata]